MPDGVKFKVSLMKGRIDLLEKANNKIANIPVMRFAYSDQNGNLKLLLKERNRKGKWALGFNTERELDIILSQYETNLNGNDEAMSELHGAKDQ